LPGHFSQACTPACVSLRHPFSSPGYLGQARALRERKKKQNGLTGASAEASAALEQHGNGGSPGNLAAVQCLADGVPLRSILDFAAARRCRLVLALA